MQRLDNVLAMVATVTLDGEGAQPVVILDHVRVVVCAVCLCLCECKLKENIFFVSFARFCRKK